MSEATIAHDTVSPGPVVEPTQAAGDRPMPGLGTLLGFLLGRRASIVALAGDRRALWIGLLFVLGAGLAREYDGEYLLAEPWHALIPLAASLAAASVLFVFVHVFLSIDPRAKSADGPKNAPVRPSDLAAGLGGAYRRFLTLFWMTAPLAWLYAIPYERLLDPAAAVRINLITLAVVSLWRVLLTARFVSVLYGVRYFGALAMVLAFGAAVAVAAAIIVPKPIFSIMGGIRHTEADRLIGSVTFATIVFGGLAVPVFLGAAAVALSAHYRCGWGRDRWREGGDGSRSPLYSPLFVFAAGSVVAGCVLLPVAQGEQRLRWEVERDLRSGRIGAALATMSEHPEDAFPPHFDPLPRNYRGQEKPALADVFAAMAQSRPPAWVRHVYYHKLHQRMSSFTASRGEGTLPGAVVALLRHVPEDVAVARRDRWVEAMRDQAYWQDQVNGPYAREAQAAVEELEAIVGAAPP